ncbi:response regulator [Oceaniglobus ichthyenteri]|uniref:response regulator n=1 Tax=Oceaniglobus ichthyenteri TaxID=2136177 RepID=UPI000F826982|nr:response regulator [Oceaniglobus ichthyenteri]
MAIATKPLNGVRILLAEDELLIAMFLDRVLTQAGADVTRVASVAEGIEQSDSVYDCALLDVSLSDGEVFPLADALHTRGIPLVFHTGNASGYDGLRAYGAPPRALEKPAHGSEILAALCASLANTPAPHSA